MGLLVVGVSHRTAPVTVLERVAVPRYAGPTMLDALLADDEVAEAMVVSTCNRVEIYVEVSTFHGGLAAVSGVLARHADAAVADLAGHLAVHWAEAAVEHLFSVAAGLDSMALGEAQILGQVRTAYAEASERGAAGRTVHEVAQRALRVGKRVHAETELDAAGASVVTEALAGAAAVLDGLGGRSALVVGAGAIGALSATHLLRRGVTRFMVANRSGPRAERLAAALRADGAAVRVVGMDDLTVRAAEVDLVVAGTGAAEAVIEQGALLSALAARAGAPLVICDLGLPRDVDPCVAELDGVVLIDLDAVAERSRSTRVGPAQEHARALVAEEVHAHLAARRAAEVAPTVAALRRRAAEVVDEELVRLAGRLYGVDDRARDEVARTVHRVVDKLLHTPTVQVKRLAWAPAGDSYAEALRQLFELAQ